MQYLLSVRALIIGLLALAGTFMATVVLNDETPATMRLSPTSATVELGSTTTVTVVVRSLTPVNAFTGEVVFDTTQFSVERIDYNTSIANLWVEEPWYNRAENSIYFAGGTTQPGGFVGAGELLRITLRATQPGDTELSIRNARIMAHDGLGSDVPLAKPLDALFSADTTGFAVPLPTETEKFVTVVPLLPPLDVNGDGVLGFQDISTLLVHFGSADPAYDFTGDGTVTWADIRTWQDLRAAN
jgi:hypothetical protein